MADSRRKETSPSKENIDDDSPSTESEPGAEEKSNSPNDSGLMFAYEDQSPKISPRDAPPGGATAAFDSPSNSPRPKKVRNAADLMTQNSPPRFVTFDEIMEAANGVTNMALAHEIAVDNDFRFQKSESKATSMEQKVKEIMHRAFWDVLQEKLSEDPPDYSQALVLLQEVKVGVLDLMLPHHQRIRAEIEAVLDLELIEQQAEHETLDVQWYAEFVISVMARLCAPVRDDEVAQLHEIQGIVPIFKAIFATLETMKLDMANFTIQQIRPYLQSQSVDYERTKFQQLLKQQEEKGQDGLKFTKEWLGRAGDKVSQKVAAPSEATSTEQSKAPPGSPSPAAILNMAYMEALIWPENYVFPETLLMDEHRFVDLQEKVQWLALVASVVMITYNTVGDPIAGVRSFKEKLKDVIAVIIGGTAFEEVGSVMPNVGTQVVKEVQACLVEHDYSKMSDDRAKLLQGLIEAVASPEQPVHKCLRQRLLSHISQLLARPGSTSIQVPPGFAAMAEEFSHVYGQFLRLVSHNRTVFGMYYADIISKYLHIEIPSPDGSPRKEKSTADQQGSCSDSRTDSR